MTGQAQSHSPDRDNSVAVWAQAILARQALRDEGKSAPAVAIPTHGRLDHLADVLGLDVAAHGVLALLYGLWSAPAGHAQITAATAAEALQTRCGRARGTLAGWQLIREVVVNPLGPVALVLDETIGDWLEGGDPIPPALRERITLREPLPVPDDWPLEEVAAFVRQSSVADGDAPVVVEVEGVAGSGRRSFVTALGGALGALPLIVDLAGLSASEAAAVARLAERAAMLSLRPVAWIGASGVSVPEGRAAFPIQMEILQPGSEAINRRTRARRRVRLGPLGLAARKDLWRSLLPAGWSDAEIDLLADRKPATIGELARVAALQPTSPAQALIAIRHDQRARLDPAIRAQNPMLGWQDLILPERALGALKRLLREIEMSGGLWQAPGLSRLYPQGRGVFALFSGASGTGKTMAAQVIAAELDVDLYVVDAGAITSKYVGETAQNLQRVFAEAEADAALLFFDECDGLFGKRTETRDAHDRYLNADTNVLLKAVESYSGACILATNRRDNIDGAFLRRLRYAIEFPRPDTALRGALWQGLLTAISDGDHAAGLVPVTTVLAQTLDFTGAQIKNAVLTALIEARADGRDGPGAADLLIGADHELMKEGRALSAAETARLRAHV